MLTSSQEEMQGSAHNSSPSSTVELLQQKVESIRQRFHSNNNPCNLPDAASAAALSPSVAAALVQFVDEFLEDVAREERAIEYYDTQCQQREVLNERLKESIEHLEGQINFMSGQMSLLSEKRQRAAREMDAAKKSHTQTLVEISTKRQRVEHKSKMIKLELERLQKIAKRNKADIHHSPLAERKRQHK